MTYKEKMAYLCRYRNLCLTLSKLKEERTRLRSWAEKNAPALNPLPAGSDGTGKLDNYIERLEELNRKIGDVEIERPKVEERVKSALSMVEDGQQQRYLAYYFLDCMTWQQAADVSGYDGKYFIKKNMQIIRDLKVDTLRHHTTP